MNRLIVLFILFLSQCVATGWNDYEINLKNGYSIFRSNSQDIQLAKTNGEHLVYAKVSFGVGNVIKYFVLKDYILTVNKKIVTKDSLSINSLKKNDKVYCIININSNEIEVFTERKKFDIKISYLSNQEVKWITIKNKKFEGILSLILTFIFQLLILSIKYYWLTIGVFIFLYLYIKYKVKF